MDSNMIGIAKYLATQQISIGIVSVSSIPGGIRFKLASGDTFDISLSSNSDLMFKSSYCDAGGVVLISNKTKTLKNSNDNTYQDGSYYLDKNNHTGYDKDSKVSIDKTNLNDILAKYTGTTLTDLVSFIDKNHEYKNGIMIGDSTQDGSFKLLIENNKLRFYRKENGNYNLIQSIGSTETDSVLLTKDSSSVSIFNDYLNEIVNVVQQAAITNNGLRFADPRLDKVFIAGNSVEQIKYSDTTLYEYDIQTDTSMTSSNTTFSFDFVIPVPNDSTILVAVERTVINLISTTPSAGITVTEKVSGREVYRSATDFNISSGNGVAINTTGLYEMTLRKPIFLITGLAYTFAFISSTPVSTYGGNLNGNFVPYAIFKYKKATYIPFLTKDLMTDSTSVNSSDKVASAKSVYTLNQAIQSLVAGSNPIIPIAVEDFNALQKGVNGSFYIFTNDGVVSGGHSLKRQSIAIITNNFNYVGNASPNPTVIQKSDFSVIDADTVPTGHIFITNVQAVNANKNVTITSNAYPDDATVNSVTTDDNKLLVTVVWDRADEWCGIPTVNGKSVSNITNVAGGTFTGNITLTSGIDYTTQLTASYGTAIYNVGITTVTPPVIQSISFGSYPNSQTELKLNDVINVTIVADKAINTVEFQDYGAFKNATVTATSGTSITVSGTIADRGTTAQQLTAKLRVKTTAGNSWSNIVESTNKLTLNNIAPSLNLVSKTFSSGFSALKNSETCLVNISTTNCNTLVSSAIGTDLNVGTMSGNNCTVTRISGSYNDNSSNLKIVGTRTANGATSTINICVEIANIAASMTAPTTLKLASGSGTQSSSIAFNQKVKITSITAPTTNLGNLVSGVTSTYLTSYSFQMSSNDTDTKSSTVLYVNAIATSMSGLTTNIQLPYLLAGFSLRTLTMNYNTLSVALPCSVVDVSKLVVSNGYINSTPLFQIMKRQVAYSSLSGETADAWAYNLSDNKIYVPSSVNSFGYNSVNNITFQIQETN